ncbi:hypothetical protein O181_005634 [Austropuccinia psidii MF-1]|uniref:Uncharacterized protein n=1 Tax=Austropuccinia psidii MF-1 TaxID=1389203 RepID=A0A9Q3BIH5_9BASI|nr:hypothetical protein [Austropuccinia psidii MF-1]
MRRGMWCMWEMLWKSSSAVSHRPRLEDISRIISSEYNPNMEYNASCANVSSMCHDKIITPYGGHITPLSSAGQGNIHAVRYPFKLGVEVLACLTPSII